ncbi:MAG TPA: NADH-quinone oxidoreductase subunit C [Planctomycetota bacterium]|nr:NADH-quinone oxidoreductase subunit C [Planctomycetota bacterium]
MNLAEQIRAQLGAAALEVAEAGPGRVRVRVAPGDLGAAARELCGRMGARLADVAGTETRSAIELFYQFCFDSAGTVVTLETGLPTAFPEIPSLAPELPAALGPEREVRDMLGVAFRGHPDMRRLVLSDDWPEGIHPMRRKYRL